MGLINVKFCNVPFMTSAAVCHIHNGHLNYSSFLDQRSLSRLKQKLFLMATWQDTSISHTGMKKMMVSLRSFSKYMAETRVMPVNSDLKSSSLLTMPSSCTAQDRNYCKNKTKNHILESLQIWSKAFELFACNRKQYRKKSWYLHNNILPDYFEAEKTYQVNETHRSAPTVGPLTDSCTLASAEVLGRTSSSSLLRLYYQFDF